MSDSATSSKRDPKQCACNPYALAHPLNLWSPIIGRMCCPVHGDRDAPQRSRDGEAATSTADQEA